jgi:hypothetical protein
MLSGIGASLAADFTVQHTHGAVMRSLTPTRARNSTDIRAGIVR